MLPMAAETDVPRRVVVEAFTLGAAMTGRATVTLTWPASAGAAAAAIYVARTISVLII
jgi:hypothetical protein